LDPTGTRMMIIYHLKSQRWLQPGGHVEAGENPEHTAIREVQEECGLGDLKFLLQDPFDIDVHEIPAGKTPAHLHFDLRYLLQWEGKKTTSPELECRWVDFDKLREWTTEESILRIAAKAQKFIRS
jgi:8-oxo-dGTP pyrophosphatase MutT (NUDIX family)